jgi:hypothetical protein
MDKTDTHSSAIIVNLDGTVWPGLDKEDAVLFCNKQIFQGRDALFALMSLVDDPHDAESSMHRGEYPPDIKEIIRTGRIDLHYLINCTGMSVALDNFFRNGESYVRNAGGKIHSYATECAQSAGAFRLGAAELEHRYVLPETSIMLHKRQLDDKCEILEPSEDEIDRAKVRSFFMGGNDHARELEDRTDEKMKSNEEMYMTGNELGRAALARITHTKTDLREVFMNACIRPLKMKVPPLADIFFSD